MAVAIKRVYDKPDPSDGFRILVDRLWPRGVSKERAGLDKWLKDVAPSPELRRWWNHDPARMDEFAHRYSDELDHNPAVRELVGLIATHPHVTLLYGARDPLVNHARILADYLQSSHN
ncbi:MAG: DUF488 family protein [Ancrocorticia sp.]|jgi:uncharacterized protein YeaO (DUF488 family)|nr:DUF488 family protein [Ancrocorticia sp.]MCI1896471.1 DUF488 family protein [Ancrocorticia sp.]MCI1933069.1 DUF488 family protein [Ancrocorticia sp.]MCI1963851.1 DUF488 family protein [Ancrocorticia sp.]MCI2002189.1 DUF488 family protein [Ancrocorticia sp.]